MCHSGKACLQKVCYKFSEKFVSKLFVAIGDGFKKVMCLGDQNRTYQRPYQTFLMMCLDGQICVWNKCTAKVWSEFDCKWIRILNFGV